MKTTSRYVSWPAFYTAGFSEIHIAMCWVDSLWQHELEARSANENLNEVSARHFSLHWKSQCKRWLCSAKEYAGTRGLAGYVDGSRLKAGSWSTRFPPFSLVDFLSAYDIILRKLKHIWVLLSSSFPSMMFFENAFATAWINCNLNDSQMAKLVWNWH